MKLLIDLLAGLPAGVSWRLSPAGGEPVLVNGIAYDSRLVMKGDAFVALPGGTADGHRYIPDAIQNGASVVVGEQPLGGFPVPYVQVNNSRLALAHLSAAYFDFPARKLTVIGVTGTDGKTTTSNLIFQILKAAQLRAGMVSTVNAVIGSHEVDTGFHVTTPEAPQVQSYLAQMVSAGLTHVVLEATSHGLAQHRVAGCDFDAAVVTNITHEHLDYHGSYAAYREAKARLFDMVVQKPAKDVPAPRLAVLNRDDDSFEYLHDRLRQLTEGREDSPQILQYGMSPKSQVTAGEVEFGRSGTRFKVSGPGFHFPVQSPLLGEYNVSNCLAAIAVTVAGMGIAEGFAQEGIRSLAAIPGRMERLDLGLGFITVVDFAHTPNALKNALATTRRIMEGENPDGRVIAVFGSAGLRDRAKRRMMAETSIRYADLTVLTAEDPRTESLEAILAEMAAGCEAGGGVEGTTFWRVPDRGDAIRLAFVLALPGDVVIVLGKGHEQSMCFGEIEYPWDDRLALKAAAAEYLGVPGPEMPYLPTQK